jgi:uncharacterized membrane protein
VGVNSDVSRILHSLQRNVISGIITAGPFFITWLVITFILGVLANAGLPLVHVLALPFPAESEMHEHWFQYILAVLLTIVLFYLIGRAMSQVVGRQMFAFFETSLERLPVVNKVYGSVRQLLETLTNKNSAGQRVVLVEFPMPGQKSLGFLTHMVTDSQTGASLATVLIPQAINPSSAFLQLVPLERITETDLTMEQAMSMLLTGGAVCPDAIRLAAAQPAGSDTSAMVEVNG